MTDERYNGWANYETWAVALWINNEQGLQETSFDIVRRYFDPDEPAEFGKIASALKDWVEDMKPDVPGMFADLLNASLCAVDWYELAEAQAEDIIEESKQNRESEQEDEPTPDCAEEESQPFKRIA